MQEGTPWAGGVYRITLEFPDTYPMNPPKCQFDPAIFHPNIFSSGAVCLSILSAEKDWKPSLTVVQILLGIQDLLGAPNHRDPANGFANNLFMNNRPEYEIKVRAEAQKYAPGAAVSSSCSEVELAAPRQQIAAPPVVSEQHQIESDEALARRMQLEWMQQGGSDSEQGGSDSDG